MMLQIRGWPWRASHLLMVFAYITLPLQIEGRTWDDTYSFGHVTPISHGGGKITSFEVTGEPRIFSDRILLTPPVPGNQRSSIWSERPSRYSDWDLEIPFRTSGPERAGGSLHIWYTLQSTGISTVYSAKPFEGLALVIDSFGGKGGSLRGFLNDGSTDYSLHHQPQALAFAHCDLSYRNLGIITTIKISYSQISGLKVMTNDQVCFETNKIRLPSGYKYGISAASADSPDSFEVFAFKVAGQGEGNQQVPPPLQQQQHEQQQSQQQPPSRDRTREEMKSRSPNDNKFEFRDSEYGNYKTQEEQFKDVHERLQALTHQIAEVQRVSGSILWKLDQLSNDIQHVQQQSPHGAIERLDNRIAGIDRQIGALDKTIKDQNIPSKLDNLHTVVKDSHLRLDNTLPSKIQEAFVSHGPSVSGGITVLIVFQLVLVIAYVVYKRRRSIAPKKYL